MLANVNKGKTEVYMPQPKTLDFSPLEKAIQELKNTLIHIQPAHLSIVKEILRKHLPTGATVWIFGSRAGGRIKKFSDLDLVIDAEKPLSSKIFADLEYDFEESDLPYKVDIVDWNSISDSFKECIKENRILLT